MHVLIVGNSYSGKTKLAQRLAADKTPLIIYDPNRSAYWPTNARKFANPDQFFRAVESAQSHYVFIDEAKTLWDMDSDRADKLVFAGRHRGLLIFLIAQRTRMIPPNARNQCSKVFAFRQQRDDALTLAAEYHQEMEETMYLPPVHFIATDGFRAGYGQLDFSQGQPPMVRMIKNLPRSVLPAPEENPEESPENTD